MGAHRGRACLIAAMTWFSMSDFASDIGAFEMSAVYPSFMRSCAATLGSSQLAVRLEGLENPKCAAASLRLATQAASSLSDAKFWETNGSPPQSVDRFSCMASLSERRGDPRVSIDDFRGCRLSA